MPTGLKIIFGAAAPWSTLDVNKAGEFLPILQKHEVKDIDTAHIYWGSEEKLGKLNAADIFSIHTKAPGLTLGGLSKSSIDKALSQSLRDMHMDSVETYFLHSPDDATPIAETMDAINEHYQAGKFRRFGVSNFKAAQLQELFDYAQTRNYVLPTVYEGNYSAITRHLEKDIFPLIRKYNMSFYAYSSLAGGFLVKSPQTIQDGKEARWNVDTRVGAMYQKMYNRPKLLEALGDWAEIAEEFGVSKAALAYRWVAHHSELSSQLGDAVIVGASRPSQLDDTLTLLEEGPLQAECVERLGALWEKVKDSAPIDNIQM